MTKPKSKKSLILHFDINETILIGDDAGGDTREECFNKILAKNAFVQIPHHHHHHDNDNKESKTKTNNDIKLSKIIPTHWWDGTPIIKKEMNDDDNENDNDDTTATADANRIKLHTKWEWISNSCPYYRTSYKHKSKNFIHDDGHCYQSYYNQMKEKMEIHHSNPNTNPSNNNIVDERISHDAGKTYFLLPSFFNTLYTITNTNKGKGKYDNLQNEFDHVHIVLRSFGSDLMPVLHSISAFAEGKHPLFPDFYHPDWIINTTNDIDNSFKDRLFRGRWKEDNNDNNNDTLLSYQLCDWNDESNIILSNELDILSLFTNNSKSSLIGIQDDYNYWSKNDCMPTCGKPIWITTNNNDEEEQYHIIMDDNIKNDAEDSIVSIREYCKIDNIFHSISGENIRLLHGKHLIRVPTIEPILNSNWFLEEIEECCQQLLLQE